ncbi:MAG: MFS transporter [Thermoflexales bacterium]|nr:MFS transporter [Thermoflexales bacterium]
MQSGRGLWRQADFLRLWSGQTISELGSRITRDGLPLVALLVLGASPSQMGVIAALGSAVVLLISLPAGVWVDRLRRKPIMLAADLGRAVLVASIPIAALTQQLRLEHLYVVVALNGGLTVLFNAAYEAYLPSLIARENLVEGNSKLALSSSMAEVLGPGLAGFLVQWLTAPIAMAADALSFLASIGSLMLIRTPEPPPAPIETRRHLAHEMIEGVRWVWGDRRLRALALAGGTRSFFGNFYAVLYSLYALRYLGLDAAALGVTIAMGGVGSLIGSALTDRVVRRFGLGRALIGSGVIGGALSFLIPLASGPVLMATLILMLSQLGGDAFNTLNGITSTSLRQAITPDRLLGRTSTSLQVMIAGVGPLGALLSGVLAETIGVRETLWLAAAGVLLSTGWLIVSPIRQVRDHAAGLADKV